MTVRDLAGRFRWARRAWLAAVLAAGALPLIGAISDPDFWWHLRAGQMVIAQRSLVDTDPFTFTAAGRPWTMQEWGTEVGYAALHSAGGIALVIVAMALVSWLGLLGIVLRARLRGSRALPVGLGLLLGSLAGGPIWGTRTQMVSFTLSCVVLLIAERHLLRGGRASWSLVPLFAVWSNLHAGFVLGIGLLILILLAEVVDRRLRPGTATPPERVRSLAVVLLACVVASLFNPYGASLYAYPLTALGSGPVQSFVGEWQSPNFHDPAVHAFELMAVSLLAMLIWNRRARPRDVVISLATLLMALQAVRNVILFVAAATPLWITQADLVLARLQAMDLRRIRAPIAARVAGLVARGRAGRPGRLPAALAGAIAIAAIAAVALAGARLVSATGASEGSPTYAHAYPVCAARWLAGAAGPLRLLNEYGEGGYLAYRLQPRGDRLFVFGDAGLLGDAVLSEYQEIESVGPQWDSIIRRTGADVVLLDRGTSLATVMNVSDRWVQVYSDQRNVAFVARDRLSSLRLPALDRAAAMPGDGCSGSRLAPVPAAGSSATPYPSP